MRTDSVDDAEVGFVIRKNSVEPIGKSILDMMKVRTSETAEKVVGRGGRVGLVEGTVEVLGGVVDGRSGTHAGRAASRLIARSHGDVSRAPAPSEGIPAESPRLEGQASRIKIELVIVRTRIDEL